MKKIRICFLCSFVLALGTLPSGQIFAEGLLNPDRDKPLEISADESLEWHRNELFFTAKKNVRTSQGKTTLHSNSLVAKYRDSDKSSIDIYHIEALGGVKIVSADSKAYGDKAVYDVDKGYAVMTGRNLRLLSTDQNVSARDRLEYWVNQGRMAAIGRAVAVREGDKLEADKIIVEFVDGKNGKRTLKTLKAIGNVVITTPTEALTGDRADYSAQTNIAVLKGNVRITRGENFLEGARAEVDLKTNISKMFGSDGDGGGGRVRGVFHSQK